MIGMSSAEPTSDVGALLESAPCGFVGFRDDGIITRINGTLLELLGYERAELSGHHVESLLYVGTRLFYQTHLFPLAPEVMRVTSVVQGEGQAAGGQPACLGECLSAER